MSRFKKIAHRLVPAVCDLSDTNVCNATGDFSPFAQDKDVVRNRFWKDRDRLRQALLFSSGAVSATSPSRGANP